MEKGCSDHANLRRFFIGAGSKALLHALLLISRPSRAVPSKPPTHTKHKRTRNADRDFQVFRFTAPTGDGAKMTTVWFVSGAVAGQKTSRPSAVTLT